MTATSDLVRCKNCPHFGKLVGSKGPENSPFVVVGESPGAMEVQRGFPFVGPSGQILDTGLAQHPDTAKGEAFEPFVTNAMVCFPGYSKAKSQDKLIQAGRCCSSRLDQEIEAYPRKAILALGNSALWALTGNYNLKITQVRGKVFKYLGSREGFEIPVIPSTHPSFLMRGGGSLRQFLADVDYAISLAKGNDFRKYIIPKIRVLENIDELRQFATTLKELGDVPVAADTETGGYNGFDYLRDRILCAGFCYDPHIVWVVPTELISEGGEILFDNNCRFVWHNGKFDAKFFRAAGVRSVRVDEDTMLLSYALDETKGIHDLEQVGSDILGCPDWKFMIQPYLDKEKAKYKKDDKWRATYDCIPRNVLYDYMARDISTTLQVFPILRRNVRQDPKLELLYTQTLLPAVPYLIKVEETGMKINLNRVQENSVRLVGDPTKGIKGEKQLYEEQINAISKSVGHTDVNPGSWQQLGVLLYDVLKFKTKDRSTDKKAIDKLPQSHPIIKPIRMWRKVAKAESTYVRPAADWINIDGRTHTTYKIHGTATGRLASEDPNILNIPRDPLLRGQFEAEEEKIYLEVDANQAELRVLAEVSGDEGMIKIYTTKGMSLHDEVTIFIWGKHEDYTPEEFARQIEKFNCQNFPERLYDEQKMRAKNVNFGIIYGVTAFGLAEQTDAEPKECQEWLNAWGRRFPGAWKFMLLCREAPIKNKTIVTPFGRKKRFGVVSPEQLLDMQNQAMNMVPQSIASDIVLHTGMEMQPIAESMGVPICNTIYDSILYECPNDEQLVRSLADQTIRCLAQKAIQWGFRRVPFLGEAKVGVRWGNLIAIDKYYKKDAA